MPPNPEEQRLLDGNESTGDNSRNQGEQAKDKEAKPGHKKFVKPKDVVTFRTHLTSLAHISVIVFVYLIFKLATRTEFEFFTWHPILMAVGWMLLMTEGFFAINKNNTYWRFKTTGGFRVKVHVCILSLGYILSITGFVIAYVNKENKGKSHFVSWHGLFGLLGLISTVPPVINGFALWYKKELKVSFPKLLKFIHVSSGTAAFAFGAISLILSVYSNWYGKKSQHSSGLFYFGLVTAGYPLMWAVYGPSVKLYGVVKSYFSEEKQE